MTNAAPKKTNIQSKKKKEIKSEDLIKIQENITESESPQVDNPPSLDAVPSYENYRNGYTLWSKLRVTLAEKKDMVWAKGVEPGIQNYWYDMAFDIVYTSMFNSRPYEIRFIKKFDTIDCAMIFPDRISEPYEFGLLTLGYHKRRISVDDQSEQRNQNPRPTHAHQFYIKSGPTYYQKEDLNKDKLQGLQTPVGKWLIAQTICEHFFFKVVISCEFVKLPRIQCLLNQEPIVMRGGKELQYRKIAQFS